MKKLIITLASIVTSCMTIAEETFQFDDPIYIGIKGGYQLADDDTYNYRSPNGFAFGLYGGIHFSPFWSGDIGYQKMSPLKASSTNVEVETWLIESALRYSWPLTTNFSIYGRLGVAYWKVDKLQKTLFSGEKATGFSPLTEMGISYAISHKVKISTNYQYINAIGKKETTGQYNSHTIFLNIGYTLNP